jgi:proteasome lid subunit RPN8/RPN11
VLRIDPDLLHDLRRHGEECYPREACGVLLGLAGPIRAVRAVLRCENGEPEVPERRYAIDPTELLSAQRQARRRGEEIVGFYHSHPDRPAHPSPTDLAEAHWLGCSYVITRVAGGAAEVTASFLLGGTGEADKRFAEEELRVEPAPAEAAGEGR